MIEYQRAGLLPEVVGVISQKLGLSAHKLLSELRLSSSSMKARQARGRKLCAIEADRMVRAARIFKRAAETLEDEEGARNLVTQPLRTLGGELPLSFVDTNAGYDLVEDERKRIEYGIVA